MGVCGVRPREADGLWPSTGPSTVWDRKAEGEWDVREPLISQDEMHDRSDPDQPVGSSTAGHGATPRRAWFGVALLLVLLLGVDLWRRLPTETAPPAMQAEVPPERVVTVEVVRNVTTTVVDHYGYNATEKTVVLFGE